MELKSLIPEMNPFKGEIVGYCEKTNLEKRETLPEANIDKPRYVKATGDLKNSDLDWQTLINEL